MKQETVKDKEARQKVVAPAKPAIDPRKMRDEILDGIAEDCALESKTFVDQSLAPEGE